jgi:hypothetical protein
MQTLVLKLCLSIPPHLLSVPGTIRTSKSCPLAHVCSASHLSSSYALHTAKDLSHARVRVGWHGAPWTQIPPIYFILDCLFVCLLQYTADCARVWRNKPRSKRRSSSQQLKAPAYGTREVYCMVHFLFSRARQLQDSVTLNSVIHNT